MKKPGNAVIIGASGTIGSYLASHLLANDIPIVPTYCSNEPKLTVPSIKLDIRRQEDFGVLDGHEIDAVVFLSAAMPSTMAGYNPHLYLQTNTVGALNVLEYCRNRGINKLVYVTPFAEVSGSFYSGVPIKETDPRTIKYTGDHAVYTLSKVAACELIEHYRQEYGLQAIVFRIPTMYCYEPVSTMYFDGVLGRKPYRAIIDRAILGEPIELWGDPHRSKDMVYIKDFVRLLEAAILHPDANGLFNVGTGNPISLEDFVSAVVRVFSPSDAPSPIIPRPDLPSQRSFTFDMTKTFSTFEFSPKFDLETMLKDILMEMRRDNYQPTL